MTEPTGIREETDAGDFEAAADGLECLRCGHGFGFAELGGFRAGADDRTFMSCPACGAHNEVRAEPSAGLGAPPKARVQRILDPQRLRSRR